MKMYLLVISMGSFKVHIYFCFLNREINIVLLMIIVDDTLAYIAENKNQQCF